MLTFKQYSPWYQFFKQALYFDLCLTNRHTRFLVEAKVAKNVCQSFQTLYEASPIINVTHRSFAVFYPIMYVTHISFAAPAPAIRDFFWYICSITRGFL